MTRSRRNLNQRNVLILTEWYDHHVRQGIGRYACEHNWHLTAEERVTIPRGWKGDGVLTVFSHRRDIMTYVRHLVVPVVGMGLYRMDIPVPRVVGDHARIGIMAAEHFADRGFRCTAWFSTTFSPVHALRFDGFRSACVGLKLNAPLKLVWEKSGRNLPEDWMRLRLWLARQLKNAPRPLAVFAYDDYDAAKVEDICRFADIEVPEEVAILGVDNNELICLNQPVPLSSIAHDLERVGYESAVLLDRLIDGKTPPKDPVLIPPSNIVLRQSTDLTAISLPAVRCAILFIKDNIGRSFGVEDVARAAGVSRSSLDRLFLLHLNRSVYDEVMRHRLETAKHLLLHTDRSCVEVARLVGFCHSQHFTNVFRKAEKMTPKAYRLAFSLPSQSMATLQAKAQ